MTGQTFLQNEGADPRATPVWLACLISLFIPAMSGLIGHALFAQALTSPVEPAGALPGEALALIRTVITITAMPAGTVLLLYLWLIFYEKRAVVTLGLAAPVALRFMTGASLGFMAAALLAAGLVLFTDTSPDFRFTQLSGFILFSTLIVLPVAWMVQALSEEMLFRGFLAQTVERRYRPVTAITISSILFAFLHAGSAPSGNYIIGVFVLGIFLCLYTIRSGSLWGPAGFHMAWNLAHAHLIGLPAAPAEGQVDPSREILSHAPALTHLNASSEAVAIGSILIALLLAAGFLILTTFCPPAKPGRSPKTAGPDDRQDPA